MMKALLFCTGHTVNGIPMGGGGCYCMRVGNPALVRECITRNALPQFGTINYSTKFSPIMSAVMKAEY